MKLIDGKEVRKEKLKELKKKVELLKEKPSLSVVQVGNIEASNVYIRQKEKLALELGYNFKHYKFEDNITEEVLENEIIKINNIADALIVQMPLPKSIDENKIVNLINPYKDVDGLTNLNAGLLFHNEEALESCTPKGIIDLLDYYNINIDGANATIVGRSNLVGKPLSMMLLNRNATVTICHSHTKNLKEITKNADILVAAVGKPKFITSDMVKEGAAVIDVGINRIDGKLIGDVDFESVKEKVSFITPVPGGVGVMTVYELMENVYKAYTLKLNK